MGALCDIAPFDRLDHRDRTAIFWGVVCCLMAHLYSWTNGMFNHDSLLIYQNDVGWQASLGRYLNPLYVLIRGRETAPLTIGIVSTLCLVASVVLVLHVLDIRSDLGVFIVAVALTTNSTVTLSSASFLYMLDVFCLSLLCAVFAVWVSKQGDRGWLIAIPFVTVSLGLYQSYLQVCVTLHLLDAIRGILVGEDIRSVLLRGMRAAITILLAGLLYILLFNVALAVLAIEPAQTANSVSSLTQLSLAQLPAFLVDAYTMPLRWLAQPMTSHHYLVSLIYLSSIGSGIAGTVVVARRNKLNRTGCMLLGTLILLLPLGMNFVWILSQGYVHALMFYAIYLSFVAVALALDLACPPVADASAGRAVRRVGTAAAVLVLSCNVMFSNTIYLSKALQERATLSLVTRILDRIEQTDGYVPGETRVAFVGNLYKNPTVAHRPGYFRDAYMSSFPGCEQEVTVTYYGAWENYFRNYLGYNHDMLSEDEACTLGSDERIATMPVFPAAGSVATVDDVVVVKLSDSWIVWRNGYAERIF